MTSTNNTYTRAQPSAPSNTQCVPNTVRDYTPNGDYSPSQRTDLQALYDRVSAPLSDVLSWINSHFTPSAPITTGRTAIPDTTTLRAYNGVPLVSVVPITIAIQASAIGASLNNASVYTVPLLQPAMVVGLAVIASGAPSGAGSITAGYLTVPIGTTTATATAKVPYLTRSFINVTANTNASWNAPAYVYATIYLRYV